MAEVQPNKSRIPDVQVGGRCFHPSRWVPAAAITSIGLFMFGYAAHSESLGPPQALANQVAQIDAGPKVLDPKVRARMIVPFGTQLWIPAPDKGPVLIPDEQMTIVGLTDELRVYALAGGGGGGPQLEFQAGEVYVRVAPGQYWPLTPAHRVTTPPPLSTPPAGPKAEPAPRPNPLGNYE